MQRFRALDAFPKTLDEFRVRTQSGGALSLAMLALVALLLVGEARDLFKRQAIEDVVVDVALHETLAIHFDISFPKLKCDVISMSTVDAAGGQHGMARQAVFKLSLDAEGHAVGHASQQDSGAGTILSHSELEKTREDAEADGELSGGEAAKRRKPQHTSCGSCYGVEGAVEPRKCCNSCKDVQEAFEFRGWPWRADGADRFWQCREEHIWSKATPNDHKELENRPEAGCDVFGSVFVPKSKGSFHFGASAQLTGRDMILLMVGLGNVNFDVSHRINTLWFGDEPPEAGARALSSIHSEGDPEEGFRGALSGLDCELKTPSLVQYYLKVVGTDVVMASGSTTRVMQYAATEHSRPTESTSLPSVHFFYDTPPLRLRYVESPKSWARFYTSVCALTGGVYSVVSALDAVLHSKSIARRAGKASPR